jgi:hypothetical protein
MSFFDTLKNLGLWQPQQGADQPNPYGLDPAVMSQARMSALGNIGGQLLAMSQQMTPDQRARMMANADWTGGYQGSVMDAAKMQMLGQAQKDKALERERMENARRMIADRIKGVQPGPARDAAMYFFEAGDLSKAGEILFTRNRVFDGNTGQDIMVDYFNNPIGTAQPGTPAPAGAAGGGGAAAPASAPAPGPSPIPAPDSTGVVAEAPADALTNTWRRILRDPALTPTEAQIVAAQGSKKGALDKYAEIVKSRRDAADKDRIANKDQADIANAIVDDRRAQIEEPAKVVQFAQSIEDTLSSGSPTAMRALATQVLFAKVLDPGSAFMTGEADLQQKAASWTQRATQYLQGTTEGTPLPRELVLEMRDIARQLGKRALQKMDTIDEQTKTRAGAFGISDQMLGNPFELRWNRFADPAVSESGTGMREPRAQALDDLERYGG